MHTNNVSIAEMESRSTTSASGDLAVAALIETDTSWYTRQFDAH